MPKELTIREVALEQLQRMKRLPGYPDSKVSIDDYCCALEVAKTREGITRAVDSIMSVEQPWMPQPAIVRRMAYEQAEKTNRDCELCGGSGFLTIYRLITYHGKSFQMKHSEPVAEAEWRALAERIAAEPVGNDRQQVISAARECSCRMRAA